MPEYIERDTAIREIERAMVAVLNDMPISELTKEIYTMAHRHCIDVLAIIPAADVQPVRHGRWMSGKEPVGPVSIFVPHCSVCGAIVPVDISRYKYCPNCGAKMDGGDT